MFLAILTCLLFQMRFEISLSSSIKISLGFWLGMHWIYRFNLGGIDIFILLNLLSLECDISFHLFRPSLCPSVKFILLPVAPWFCSLSTFLVFHPFLLCSSLCFLWPLQVLFIIFRCFLVSPLGILVYRSLGLEPFFSPLTFSLSLLPFCVSPSLGSLLTFLDLWKPG